MLGASLKYAHSTPLFGSAVVQYNTATEQVVSSVRVNFIHALLSKLFPVYTERWGVGGGPAAGVLERFLTARVTRMMAF